MKNLILILAALFSTLFTGNSFATPSVQELEVFSTCPTQLDEGIRYGKKVIISDFNLNIRQKDILAYGPYSVGDQYFKVDYIILKTAPGNSPVKITAEFNLYGGDEGACTGVQFHDWVY